MNKEEITVGDVYRCNEWLAVVISKDPNFDVNGRMNILFSDGDITPYDADPFLEGFCKVGHIKKFAEALKELQETAEKHLKSPENT